jgi:hypothetical protein
MRQTFKLLTTPPREIHVPMTWHDMTIGELFRLKTEPETPRLCIVTDLTKEELSIIDPQALLYFANCLDFMSDREHLNELLHYLSAP